MLRPALVRETDLRDRLGKVMQKGAGKGKGLKQQRGWVDEYAQIVKEVKERMDVSRMYYEFWRAILRIPSLLA